MEMWCKWEQQRAANLMQARRADGPGSNPGISSNFK